MEAANSSRGASTAGMHAFLFADLRGYTQFAATRGDRAAAHLLDRYRSLVREQVARHAGAEVRTEGDSFYVVVGSLGHEKSTEPLSRDFVDKAYRVIQSFRFLPAS